MSIFKHKIAGIDAGPRHPAVLEHVQFAPPIRMLAAEPLDRLSPLICASRDGKVRSKVALTGTRVMHGAYIAGMPLMVQPLSLFANDRHVDRQACTKQIVLAPVAIELRNTAGCVECPPLNCRDAVSALLPAFRPTLLVQVPADRKPNLASVESAIAMRMAEGLTRISESKSNSRSLVAWATAWLSPRPREKAPSTATTRN